jgi:hypothetical protein
MSVYSHLKRLLNESAEEWIGVDLDGTLAHHDSKTCSGPTCAIGDPIPDMIRRVKGWLRDGKTVKIFTARASNSKAVKMIQEWSKKHIGKVLDITNVKDQNMKKLWDDRAVQVRKNTGKTIKG